MLYRLAPFCLALLLAAPAQATVRAVLVGVSDYLVLDADLKGPANDVRLMAEVLAGRGVAPADMQILTSDPAGLPAGATVAVPVRGAILSALAQAAAQSAPGDTVVFYFSGHGAQAPDQSGDEGGGNDEILLPADAAGWKGAIGAVENAILDDELQSWAQGLLARGVQLVGLIDACHSDTGFRALGGAGVPRGLGPAALGIPAEAVSAPAGAETPPLTGAFVFLYSSQSDQRSFEYPVGDSGLWQGEFTLRLAEALRRGAGSWAQVLAASSDAMVQGPARQVPDGEGPLLQAPVFGHGAAGERWVVKDGAVQAGLLQGLNPGDVLAFYAAPAGGPALAEAALTKVEPRRARVAGAAPAAARWAELAAPAPAPPVELAPAVRADPGDGQDYAGWLAALGSGVVGADLVPILTEGGLALAGADGALDPAGPGSSPRLRLLTGETPAQALNRVLAEAGHALRLRKLLAGVAGRSLTGKPVLQVSYERRPAPAAAQGCGPAGPAVAFDPAAGLRPCEQLWVRFTNVSGKPVDVSLLYFSADFQIGAIWPQQGLSNRLAPGETARAGLQIDPGSVLGLDELMVLAVPVAEDGARVDLTRLASPDTTRDAGPGAGWFAAQLTENGETARGFSARPAALNMVRQVVRVLPPPQG